MECAEYEVEGSTEKMVQNDVGPDAAGAAHIDRLTPQAGLPTRLAAARKLVGEYKQVWVYQVAGRLVDRRRPGVDNLVADSTER